MSTPLRTIVAGVASAHSADPIVAPAIALAEASGATLHLVHVYELPDPLLQAYARDGFLGNAFGGRYRDSLRASLEAQMRAVASTLPVHCHAVAGPVSDTLCGMADQLGADLILVGATRAGKLLRAILGSTAERVVRSAAAPVLILRGGRIAPIQRVLLTTDLSPFSAEVQERGLDMVEALAGRTPPRLRSLLVVWYEMALPPPLRRDALEEIAAGELEQFLAARRPRSAVVEPRVRIGDPAKEISAEVTEWQADLLVLGTHSRTGRSRFLLGSVAEAAARSTTSDVLILPPTAVGLRSEASASELETAAPR